MKKKKADIKIEVVYSPHPSGKSSEEIVLGIFYDFCLMEVAKKNRYKITISREEYIRKVIAREIGLYDAVYYFEPLTPPNNDNQNVKDIMSIQSSQLSLSLFYAKRQASIFQSYVDMIETYKPYSLETAIIHEYAIHGNVAVAAEKLNEKGYRINGKTVKSGDISSVLMMSPIDELHRIVSNQFRKNKGLDSF
ncbi:hypothetical protein SAMN04488542_10551 [Fontibacillus panacisegetis]|uniref:Uncharacterized protein n=1 Tax=Fontibacillus panacisegetis TaxID=670482 RepID=A0A1G7HV66_9BACL|nr:hypothetical protein [Fontibacillus panacisegetis]SDF04417.1 hypothetical protein SAMN04488542_10551 [Fontibacillus panacisegetis]